MAFRLASTDGEILMAIAECRIMTVPQVAALLSRSSKGLRTRIHELLAAGFLEEVTRGHGQRRGRPERVVSLRESGVRVLKERGLIEPQVPFEAILGESLCCQSHQLLLNWVRIHLRQVERVLPNLSVRFFAHNSPFVSSEVSNVPVASGPASVSGKRREATGLRPDAVFSICERSQGKTLLFFLEVDLGTETVASPSRDSTDIRQKILNYGACFDTLTYKRYERLWNCQLNGFRLLFLTDSLARLSTLCTLVREMPPSDFIWLTEKSRMFGEGISAEIWARGGRLDTSPQSILGRLHCRAPLR